MDDIPPDVPEHLGRLILISLLRVHSKRLEGVAIDECLRAAYDAYASELKTDGRDLKKDLLDETIPGWVFDWAVRKQWLPYPAMHRLRSPLRVLGDGSPRGPFYVPVPDSELTTTLGEYRVTDWYKADVMKWLESRITYWQAEALLAMSSTADAGSDSISPDPSLPTEDCQTRRRFEIDRFLQKCNKHSSVRIRRKHIWLSVGHSKGRQFEYWQACDEENTTNEDDVNFNRVLRNEPEAFLNVLKQKNLIPQN